MCSQIDSPAAALRKLLQDRELEVQQLTEKTLTQLEKQVCDACKKGARPIRLANMTLASVEDSATHAGHAGRCRTL
jgi:hypothetical protein